MASLHGRRPAHVLICVCIESLAGRLSRFGLVLLCQIRNTTRPRGPGGFVCVWQGGPGE